MAPALLAVALLFLIGLIVSALIIFAVARLFGEREGPLTALASALVGTVIYVAAFYLLGQGFLASVIGGVVWLGALKGLYNMSWLKTGVVALFVWVAAAFVGVVVPTVVGPL